MRKCRNAGFSLPAELMNEIDAQRGDISRSRYLLRLIEKACIKEMLQQRQGQRVCGSNPVTAEAKV
jgi:hypothetical protein